MYQKITIVGNLGRDPEMRYTPQGTPVTNFSVATNRKWTNADGTPGEETTWFRVSAWGRTAEVCNEYLSKGRQVLVEGQLRPDPQTGGPRVWTGNDGIARASFEVTARTVRFLGGRGEAVEVEPGVALEEPPAGFEEGGEELPF
jgi:single-strand DNA-binding protein